MKRIATLTLVAALTASGVAFGQSGNMNGMDMDCTDMKDMKGMDMKACKDMMKDTDSGSKARGASDTGTLHKASAVVKAVDPAMGKVTLAHEPIKSLKWPAMTMGFSVKDKSLFDKLKVGKQVDVQIAKQGSDYVVTGVK